MCLWLDFLDYLFPRDISLHLHSLTNLNTDPQPFSLVSLLICFHFPIHISPPHTHISVPYMLYVQTDWEKKMCQCNCMCNKSDKCDSSWRSWLLKISFLAISVHTCFILYTNRYILCMGSQYGLLQFSVIWLLVTCKYYLPPCVQ